MPSSPPATVPVDLEDVELAVGAASFKRGRTYANANKVLQPVWDGATGTLRARVIGNGALYETQVVIDEDTGEYLGGDCSCPIGLDCKHVAALAVAVAMRGARNTQRSPAAAPVAQPAADQWERSLRALLPVAAPGGDPLAIELKLDVRDPHRPRLDARLQRPGARDRWIAGNLAWSALDPWDVGGLRADHVDIVRSIYAGSDRGRRGYYAYGAEKTLDLTTYDGAHLWDLLDDAVRAGITLLPGGRDQHALPRPLRGEIVLDVARDGTDRRLATRLLLDGVASDLTPRAFLGAAGHGLACSTADGLLQLVRLARPVPPPLREQALQRATLTIPAAGIDRFASELWPALRHVVAITSSDGSFVPPEISAPTLVLHARHGDGLTLDAGWLLAYTVGDEPRHVPLEGEPAAFRDHEAERSLLTAATIHHPALTAAGLLDRAGRPLAAPVTLRGMGALTFTESALDVPDPDAPFELVVAGERPDYRDVGAAVAVEIATSAVADDRDWFGLAVEVTVEGRALPFAAVFSALAAGQERLMLPDGGHFSLETPALQTLRRIIDEARALTDAPPGELRISRYQSSMWEELCAVGVVTAQAQGWQRHMDALRRLDDLPEHEIPGSLRAELRPYQREGFAWLATLWDLGIGGILADDMGLGKTVQTLAMLCHAREQDPQLGPTLVVAPTSVVPNWVTEAAAFAPGLRVVALTDTLAKSRRTIEEVVADADIVVTTYTLLRLDAERHGTVDWSALILDEAQAVKNHRSKTYATVRALPAPFKLAITGTPMENGLLELWSLLSITAPGLFPDPSRFSEHYAKPIERGDAEKLAVLRRRVRPLMKRRSKELVAADLPEKQEQVSTVELHPRHRKIYETNLARERQKILGLLDDFDRNRFTILRSITLLRQLSLHAGLVDDAHESVPCAKLDTLVDQLAEVRAGGHRALVFSQFTGFLAKVRDRLESEGVAYAYLDGRTRDRARVVRGFREGDAPVFLISLKAGGAGLNLTEADYCFLLDPWWNPATEAQAVDRTHRIGQTKPVMVYRMVSAGTIEEKVVALAQRKAALFRGVMDDGDLFSGTVTAQDIRGLLG